MKKNVSVWELMCSGPSAAIPAHPFHLLSSSWPLLSSLLLLFRPLRYLCLFHLFNSSFVPSTFFVFYLLQAGSLCLLGGSPDVGKPSWRPASAMAQPALEKRGWGKCFKDPPARHAPPAPPARRPARAPTTPPSLPPIAASGVRVGAGGRARGRGEEAE